MHLNFTEFLSYSKKISSNLKYYDNNGIFRSKNRLPSSFIIFNSKSILEEWTFQYESIFKKGVSISHIDSHQHFHTRPHSFLALKMFTAQTGIRWIRNTSNIYEIEKKSKKYISIKYLTKLIWSETLKYSPPFIKTINYFGSVIELYNLSRISNCSFIKISIVELMCHLGHEIKSYEEEISILGTRF